MTKNDFDIDFDFEEEYGFDPKAFLGNDEFDENIDLTEFSDEELGLHAPVEEPEEEMPQDFDSQEEPAAEFQDEPEEALPYAPSEEFSQDPNDEEEGNDMEQEPEEEYQEEPQDEEEPQPVKKPRKPKAKKPPKPKKEFHTPKFLLNFYDIYFAPLSNKSMLEEPQDPSNPRRRRRKSRSQIFKEIYLPPILVCLCAVLVLSFLMGSVADLISEYSAEKSRQEAQLQEESHAASEAEQEYQRVLREAEALANNYDYQGAIDVLNAFQGSDKDFPRVKELSAEYYQIKNQLTEYSDPSMIPNLSFQVLMNDIAVALQDKDYGGQYNRNFVSTKEFAAILQNLYDNGYVLVNFDNFVDSSVDTNGKDMFFEKSIYLPDGKKPIMLTQTMVNYYKYMIRANDKWEPTSKGASFANKLVVQNGEIKAQYMDANGSNLVGDYDLVPILETFIKSHPDFSYQGARATLAVTGEEGIFGYRINTDLISTMGREYHDEQVAGAKKIVDALKDKGYRIACYTFANKDYKQQSVQQISEDLQNWKSQVVTVIGQVDTMVFAKSSNISDYSDSGNALKVLLDAGFRFFVSNDTKPWAEVNTSFVRQNRMMVTGNSMAWHKQDFQGIFDCGAILDVTNRGSVPN